MGIRDRDTLYFLWDWLELIASILFDVGGQVCYPVPAAVAVAAGNFVHGDIQRIVKALKKPNFDGPKKWLTKANGPKKWPTGYGGLQTQKKPKFWTSTGRQNGPKCWTSADEKLQISVTPERGGRRKPQEV